MSPKEDTGWICTLIRRSVSKPAGALPPSGRGRPDGERGGRGPVLETSGYTIAAEAADGAQALAAVERFSPDAAFVDVQLPDIDGLALTRRLHQTDGSLRIVLTSTDPTLVAPAALAQSGAVAFVPKDKLAITDLAPLLGDDRGQATGKPHARSSVRPIPAAHCRAYGPAMLNPQPHQLGWTNDQLSAIRREVAAETEDQS